MHIGYLISNNKRGTQRKQGEIMEDTKENYLEYLKEAYIELVVLNSNVEYKTVLVKERNGNKILVKKELPIAQLGIYQQLQSIRQPNLLEISDVYCEKNICVVLADFVSGKNLQEKLEEKGKLSYAEAMNYLAQILEGLAEIHRYHIIHRDLKPENILISTDGVIKLLDFGIARFQKENKSKDTMILGTVGYASPEQFGFQQTDVRTDIYAVGILLNKMLTGKMPHEGLVEDKRLRKIIEKCTEIDPKNRYMSVEELKKALWGRWWKKSANDSGKVWINDIKIKGVEERYWIPGFRTGVKWKKRVACSVYAVFLCLNGVYISETIKGGVLAVILEIMAMLLYMWLPVSIGSNLFHWDKQMPIIRSLPRELRVAIRVVLCILLFYFGILVENYVKFTIMEIPHP